jgi:hypothetical protein
MPAYCTLADLKTRLMGKVRFTTDELDDNKMQESLATALIEEAEAEIEMRLSVRYEVPFVTESGADFSNLPQTTRLQIKAIALGEAVKRVLGFDFGRGSASEGDKYLAFAEKDVNSRIDRLIEIREGQFNHFRYPPLPGIKLAAHNSEGDDGYAGRVLTTSDGYGSYPSTQINEPSETVFSQHQSMADQLYP